MPLARSAPKSSPSSTRFHEYNRAHADLLGAQEMLSDPDMKTLAEEETHAARGRMESIESDLQRLLLPKDPNDDRNIFLEVRAGTGGDESALFAGDLLRMYMRFAERHRWTTEMISESPSDLGGYKEAIVRIVGTGAYSKLKFESGGHRVQRVPETEAQGRIHTSACTVAVLPEADEINEIRIDPDRRSASTCTGHPARAASTSTRPRARCASRTCRPASWSSARMIARSTRTASAR